MHNLVFWTVFLRKKLFVFQGFCKFAVVFNMKRLFGILLILCSMCSMLLVSCRFGSNESDEDVANDSLSVDTLGLEELDLFEEEVVPKAADEVFDDFLFTYVSNASFRKQRTKGSESLDMDDDDAVVMIYERENDLELQKDTTLQQVINPYDAYALEVAARIKDNGSSRRSKMLISLMCLMPVSWYS